MNQNELKIIRHERNPDMKSVIVLGDGKLIYIPQYCRIVKAAKANPDMTFERNFSDIFPVAGKWIVRQFGQMVTDHCNRGLDVTNGHSPEHYLLRRIKHGKLTRQCKWCGATFAPRGINDKFCCAQCARDY